MDYASEIEKDEIYEHMLSAVALLKIRRIVDSLYFDVTKLINDDLRLAIYDNYIGVSKFDDENRLRFSDMLFVSLLFNRNTGSYVAEELTMNKSKLIRRINDRFPKFIENGYNVSEIDDIIYYRKDSAYRGDVASTLRLYRTESTRLNTLSKLQAVGDLKSLGYIVKRSWKYTYESKEPRQTHMESNGVLEDDTGFFTIGGIRTRGPGLFGIPSEDINCRCDTDVIVYAQEDNG